MPGVNPVRSFRKYLLIIKFKGEAASLARVCKNKAVDELLTGSTPLHPPRINALDDTQSG